MTPGKRRARLFGPLLLLLTAFIWGSSFVAQSVGMEEVEAFTFNGIRTLLGAFVLLPVIWFRDRQAAGRLLPAELAKKKASDRQALGRGAILGLALCLASNLQQFAFYDSTSGKIAFITAMYMFFVPIFGLFLRKRVPALTWFCVACGFAGLYLLCIDPGDLASVNRGDFLAFLCAIVYAVHILLIERFAKDADGIRLSCVQFAVSGTISCLLMFLFEHPDTAAIGRAVLPLLYSGILSCGFAYTFQVIGQKYTEATVASLLMSMESVFGVLCSALILHERLTSREILGCLVMFAAIVLSQLSDARDA